MWLAGNDGVRKIEKAKMKIDGNRHDGLDVILSTSPACLLNDITKKHLGRRGMKLHGNGIEKTEPASVHHETEKIRGNGEAAGGVIMMANSPHRHGENERQQPDMPARGRARNQ